MAPEVDGLAWLPVQEARALLTHAADAEPLGILEAYARAGGPATAPVFVVRHATSRPRGSWAGADADRPLVSAGRRQARGLVPLLACWRPQCLVSSPWRRCLDTIGPYAASAGLDHSHEEVAERGRRPALPGAHPPADAAAARTRPARACVHPSTGARGRARRRPGGLPAGGGSKRPDEGSLSGARRGARRARRAHRRSRTGARGRAAPAARADRIHPFTRDVTRRSSLGQSLVTGTGWACSPCVHDLRTVASPAGPSVGAGASRARPAGPAPRARTTVTTNAKDMTP